MVEEKKEEKPVGQVPPKATEETQAKIETKTEVAPQVASVPSEQGKKEEKKKEVGISKEKPSNCAACNKSIKRKRWYYRNGKYYCTKRCWKTSVKKEEKPKSPEDKK